ncbi:MAG TPA: hypothetical protein VGO40_24485 [Longimicrobium sp.]|jgi:hypothetical protein|nr:hypothetical protein [Longimicrobium sp.]
MDTGQAALTRRVAAALGVAAAASCAASADAVPRGERFPLGSGAAPMEIVWVLRPDDYLTCQTAADGVRRLQRQYGGALPVSVVGVGAHPEWLRGFLRRQRIEAGITSLSERDFRRRFRRQPTP